MIATIIKIRLLQVFRLLKTIGLLRILFLLVVFGVVLYAAYGMMIVETNTMIFAAIASGLILLIHLARKDTLFLKKNIDRTYPLFFVEYMFVLLPFYIIWGISGNYLGLIFIMITNLLIPFIPFSSKLSGGSGVIRFLINPFDAKGKTQLNIALPFVKPIDFEWTAGIRKHFLPLTFLYFLLLAFSFKPMMAPIGMLIVSAMTAGFYFYGESRDFILLYADNPKSLIRKKITANTKYLSCLFLPMVIIALVFQFDTWCLVIGALAASCFIQLLAIVFKYGLFEENSNLNRNGMFVYFNIFFIVFPILLPVPVFMGIRYYFKAIEKLNDYYD